MNRRVTRFVSFGLVLATLFGGSSELWARSRGSSAMRRSMQQQQKQQQMMMQMQMKVMQEAMARQAAYQKQVRENLAAASTARQEKEAQRLQNIIDRRKAEQSSKSSGDLKPAPKSKP